METNKTVCFTNALLIDCTDDEPRECASVVVENDRIREVSFGASTPSGNWDEVIDCQGRTLMPGLTDAHVHIGAVDVNILDQHRTYPGNLTALKMARTLEQTLLQGFTTVRDAGGTDWGFKAAVDQGLVNGPRLRVCNLALSQTGGHGDKRRISELQDAKFYLPTAGMGSVVCDGVDEVRKATRELLRTGADHIKVHASGGAMSPADELDATQYSIEEIRTAVEEAEAAGKYVMVHAYNSASVRNCLKAGARTIEHGNLIDEETARMIKDSDAYLVPTLVTYELLSEEGARYGVPKENIRKIDEARERGLEALRYAYEAGVKIASGSDLLGPLHVHKARELEIKAQVMSPMESIISATKTNAELLEMDDDIGTVEEGKLADLLVIEGNPLDNIGSFQEPTNLRVIVKGGEVFKDTLR